MWVTQSCPVILDPWTVAHQVLCPQNFPGKNIGVCSYSFLKGLFLTQGSNPGLPHCRQILYHLNHQGRHSIQCYTVKYTKAQPLAEDAHMWQSMPNTWTNLTWLDMWMHACISECSKLKGLYVGDVLYSPTRFIAPSPTSPRKHLPSWCFFYSGSLLDVSILMFFQLHFKGHRNVFSAVYSLFLVC